MPSRRLVSTAALRAPASMLVLLLVAAALVTGCGSSSSSSGGDDPAKAVPASSLVFASVQVRPEGDVKSGIEEAGKKILAGRELGPELRKLFDRALAGSKLTYDKDFEPWLGRRVAVAVTGVSASAPEAVVLANVTDEGKARATLDKAPDKGTKKSYRGVDYYASDGTAVGITDGFFLFGITESSFRGAVDALKGDANLADSSSYKDATGKVTTDGLGLLYIDTKRFLDVIQQSSPEAAQTLGQLQTLPQFRELKPTAAALTADGDAVRIDAAPVTSTGDHGAAAADAVAKLPADSWLAFASPNAGQSLRAQLNALPSGQRAQLEQFKRLLLGQTGIDLDRDVLGWIKGFSVFATGKTLGALNAALVLDSSDPAASRRALGKIARLVARRPDARFRRTPDGFQIQPPSFPAPLTFAVTGDRVLIGFGKDPQAALEGSDTLDGSDTYREAQKALGGDKPTFLISVSTITEIAANLGAPTRSRDYAAIEPYLKAFGAITAGTVESGGEKVARLAVGLR